MSDSKPMLLSSILLPAISGNRPSGGVSSDTDGVPSIGGENIVISGGMKYDELKRIPASFYKFMPKGKLQRDDVLINKDGAQTGKVGIYDGRFKEAAINEHVFILRSQNPEKLDQNYLYYCVLLPETRSKIERRITGSAQPGLNSQFMRAVDIPYREVPKQRKIAFILQTIDQTIEKTETLIEKYQQVKAGLMHDLFTRGIGADGKLRPPREQAPELYQETPIGWIPKEWGIKPLGQLFVVQLGKMLSRAAKSGKTEFLYLGNKNVQWDFVDLSDLESMEFSETEREKFKLKQSDLLVCEGGDVGRTSIWRGEIDNCYYQKAIHRLRPQGNEILPGYMLRFMRYSKNKGLFINFTSQTSIAHLTREKLSKVPVCLPNREEQGELVKRFDGIDAKISREQDMLNKLELQKSGLMHDLLTGKVQVRPNAYGVINGQ